MLFRVTSVKPNPIRARAKVQQPPLINNSGDWVSCALISLPNTLRENEFCLVHQGGSAAFQQRADLLRVLVKRKRSVSDWSEWMTKRERDAIARKYYQQDLRHIRHDYRLDGCIPEFAQVGSGITGNISWSGPPRQWYRPSLRPILLLPTPIFPFLSSSSSLRGRDSLGGLSSPFHSVFHRSSLFVRGRIMVFRSIVLCACVCVCGQAGGGRLNWKYVIWQCVKSSDFPRDSRFRRPDLRRRNPLLLICHRCRLETAFSPRGCGEIANSYRGQNLDDVFFPLRKIWNVIWKRETPITKHNSWQRN